MASDDIKTIIDLIISKFDSLEATVRDDISEVKGQVRDLTTQVENLKEKKGLFNKMRANWAVILLLFFLGRASYELVDYIHQPTTPVIEQSVNLPKANAPASTTEVTKNPHILNKKLDHIIVNSIIPNGLPSDN